MDDITASINRPPLPEREHRSACEPRKRSDSIARFGDLPLLSVGVAIHELFDCPALSTFAARLGVRRGDLLAERLEIGGAKVDELLAQVASMPEDEVHGMIFQPRDGVRS